MDALGPARSRPSARRREGTAQLFRRPRFGCCRRQQDCDGRCVARGRRSPCPGRRPELVAAGVREAEQRPLLRSLFRPVRGAALGGRGSLFSPSAVVSGFYRGTFWPQGLGAAMVCGVSCSLFRVRSNSLGPGSDRSQSAQSLHFVFLGVFGCCFLFSLPPTQRLGLASYRESSPSTLPC